MNINVKNVKICVTIPKGETDRIRTAICDAGAGTTYTNYTDCSTVTEVIGTFKPTKSANPYIGQVEKLEYVEEDKLEVICDIKIAKKVISVLRSVHPYEQPAIDIIPLIDEDSL